MKHLFQEFNNVDVEVIKRQLGTDFISISGIVERCKWDCPTLILLYPVRGEENKTERGLDYKSMSNLLWLTCPYINKKVHQLESQGYIKKIEKFILNDRGFASIMKYAHAHYFYFRKKVYRHFLGDVTSIDENSRVFDAGIGGIVDTDYLKCLHLHYAHYKICKDNFAGKVINYLLNGDIYCKESVCCHENS